MCKHLCGYECVAVCSFAVGCYILYIFMFVCSTRASRPSLFCVHCQLQMTLNKRAQQRKRKALSRDLSLSFFLLFKLSPLRIPVILFHSTETSKLDLTFYNLDNKRKNMHFSHCEYILIICISSCILILFFF